MTLPKKIEKDQRREAILKAAALVFAQKGISVTTKELAKASGVSEALIYKHFKSKKELFSEVQTRCCNSVHPIADLVLLEKNLQERLGLSLILLSYVILVGFEKDVLPQTELHKMVLRSLASDGEFSSQIFSNFQRWIPPISENMTENQKLGFLTKFESSNEELLWMVHHFVLGVVAARLPKNKIGVFKKSPEELIKEVTIQSLLMVGMKYEDAKETFKKSYKKFKTLEGV